MIQADIRVLFTQDAAYHTEPYSPPWRGRDEIVRQWLDRKDEPSQAEFRWHLLAVAPEVVVRESSDQGDDGAPVRVQGEDHGDTPAVKGENVADDGSQREVEGGDHRFPLRLCHRGPPPPIEPAAQDHGRRQDQPGRVVQRLRTSPQGLRQGRGRRRRARLIRGPPARPEAASSS